MTRIIGPTPEQIDYAASPRDHAGHGHGTTVEVEHCEFEAFNALINTGFRTTISVMIDPPFRFECSRRLATVGAGGALAYLGWEVESDG